MDSFPCPVPPADGFQSNIEECLEYQEKEDSLPHETPMKKSFPNCSFDTPNFRNSGKRLDILYMSGLRRPQNEVCVESKKISKKEIQKFVNRTEKAEEQKKMKIEELKRQEDRKIKLSTGETKHLTQKEIDCISNRLSMTPFVDKGNKRNENKHINAVPQTPISNSHVFDRLYLQSTCKKKICEDEIDEPKQTTSRLSLNSKSLQLASKHDIQKIAEVFVDVQTCTYEEMMKLFRQLSIVDDSSCESDIKIVEKAMSSCLTGEGIYSACQMKEILLDCFSAQRQNSLSRLVSSKISLARSNERMVIKNEEIEDEQNEVHAAKMQKETLERLLSVRPIEMPKEEPIIQVNALSSASKDILRNSSTSKMVLDKSINERESLFIQKRNEIINKLRQTMQQEEEKNMKAPLNLGEMPKFYKQLTEDLKTRTQNNTKSEEVISHTTKTNSYEEYKKKVKIGESTSRPNGWDHTVERIRLGRVERNRVQASLDIRNSQQPIKKSVKFVGIKQNAKREQHINNTEQNIDITNNDEIDNVLGI